MNVTQQNHTQNIVNKYYNLPSMSSNVWNDQFSSIEKYDMKNLHQ